MQQVKGAISEWLAFNEYDIDTGSYMASQWRERGEEYCKHTEHRHSGIALLTPANVHFGRVEQKTALRQIALDAAYVAHPERFVHGRPTPLQIAPATYINRPSEAEAVQPQAA